MTICYFGNYQQQYSRNNVLIQGLRQNGCQVVECQTRATGLGKYLALYRAHRRLKPGYDILVVAFAGHSLVWFAKLLSSKPVIFDAFVSLYLSEIADRKNYSPQSLHALYYKFLDKISCRLADKILLDTQAQINYFTKNYKIDQSKFVRIPVGANDNIFFPASSRQASSKFIVHWHGYMVPFYSFETILSAAKILSESHPDIHFRIITKFNNHSAKYQDTARELGLTNFEFIPSLSYPDLARAINQADCALGIFGSTTKSQLVIPNKIIEALACRLPVISAATPAIKELFKDREHLLLCRPNDPQDLAAYILLLKNDKNLAKHIAQNGHNFYLNQLTPRILGKNLVQLFQDYAPQT